MRTIWGYLAYRLAGDEGLALVGGAEEAGTNPGGEALEKVLRATGGPALILLDEIVAYVKQLGGERYEANLSFFQSLTEAAARVPQALVVGSLPESEDEAGGDRGRETLARLEKLFGRVQSSWQAAQGTETYAIVRRRLFQELDEAGEKARDKTIDAYRRLYRENKKDFPAGVDEAAYAELMREAYPVHPMLFDKLAQEWGTLERFQRTRGVLKFIAESARRIWMDTSNAPLIQPGSIPLGDPAVRGSVIEPLEGQAWAAIVDGEVESDRALPLRLDGEKQRYGEQPRRHPIGPRRLSGHGAPRRCARWHDRRRCAPGLRRSGRERLSVRRRALRTRRSVGPPLHQRHRLLVRPPADAAQAGRKPGARADRVRGRRRHRRPAEGRGAPAGRLQQDPHLPGQPRGGRGGDSRRPRGPAPAIIAARRPRRAPWPWPSPRTPSSGGQVVAFDRPAIPCSSSPRSPAPSPKRGRPPS